MESTRSWRSLCSAWKTSVRSGSIPLFLRPDVRREVHASGLLAAFRVRDAASPPPQLMGAAIDRAYESAGWEEETTAEEGLVLRLCRASRRLFREESIVVGTVAMRSTSRRRV